jgi:ERCC4-type nuclease
MKLIIDHREKDLKEYFKSYDNIFFQNLEVGDIQFEYEGKLVLLIERKSIPDFISSFKTKRYSEQKIRLKNNVENNKILYLIEGNLGKYPEKIDGLSKKTIISSFISLLIKDNLKIYQCNNLDETKEFIHRIYKRLKEQPDKLITKMDDNINTNGNNIYSQYIKLKKKDNLTPENCYISQLSQIPGISNNIAKNIVSEYNSIGLLCKKYEINPQLLEHFEYDISNNKKRKIGKKTNNTIYNFLFNK